MSNWHTCNTSHCWAGWIVQLAGKEGHDLEELTSCAFAASQIYKASNGESVNPCNFHLKDGEALEKINKLAGE